MTSGGKVLSVVEELEDEPYFWQAKKPAERARRARVRAVIGFFTGLNWVIKRPEPVAPVITSRRHPKLSRDRRKFYIPDLLQLIADFENAVPWDGDSHITKKLHFLSDDATVVLFDEVHDLAH